MTEILFLVQDSPEGGYEARALGHSIFTEADTLDELRFMIKDAVACHFDGIDRKLAAGNGFVSLAVSATVPVTSCNSAAERGRNSHSVADSV